MGGVKSSKKRPSAGRNKGNGSGDDGSGSQSNQSKANETAQTPTLPANTNGSDFWQKVILILIEAIIVGALGALMVQQYLKLRDFSDIRYQSQKIESKLPGEATAKFRIYKLGRESVPNVTLNFGLDDVRRQQYEIVNPYLVRREQSVLELFTESNRVDLRGHVQAGDENDEDYNSKVLYRFVFDEISPDYVEEFFVTVKKKAELTSPPVNPSADPGFILELTNNNRQRVGTRMQLLDYLRLYVDEVLILAILLLATFAILIWIAINRFLKSARFAS